MSSFSISAVIIGYVWPEPDSSAAGQNMMALMRQLTDAGMQVTFMTAAADSAHKADLSALGVSAIPVSLNCSSFDEQLAELNPSLVIFDRYMTEEQFSWRVRRACPDAIRILNTEDLHFLRNARHDAVKSGLPASQASLNTTLMQRELASILRSDLTLLVSREEQRLLSQELGVPPDQLVYHPLPVIAAENEPRGFDARSDFVFIGNFRHAPNWDAVLQLQQCWPAIRKALPSAVLRIYGAYPPKKATAMHNPARGFFIEGWADDASEVIRQARVLLAPLRFGAGVKGKLLSAMALGTPSVTTSIGAEGIASATDWPGAVSDDADEFAREAVALYTDPARWQHAQAATQPCIAQYLNQPDADTLLARLDALLKDPDAFRRARYLQGMLWHHTLRSTQYMSQWIEAKNTHDSGQ
ncbi:glycosyltransferase [Alteromonas sp. CYL-A6]|uniref:glycosyltransferase n=1 Tax=Alteromonas nitratireducens TaxID=3390813 RepID=UPI0034B8BCB9